MLMGNDDLVAEGAFRAVSDGLAKYGDVGAILRAYTFFREDPARPEQVNRYYPSERLIPAGRAAILACYRRFVGVSGIVLHRDAAAALATDALDGMVFYQLWAASAALATRPALYLPTILAHYRRGGTPDFGNSEAERANFSPGIFTLPQQVHVVRGFFAVAAAVEREHKLAGLTEDLRRDFGRYSYHTLVHFAKDGRRSLWAAYRAFGEFGLRRSWWYHAWFVLLMVLGARLTDGVIQLLRRTLGFTPNLTRTPD
jgi:abequosyltransferase